MEKEGQPSASQAEGASVEQAQAECPGPQAGNAAVADAQPQAVSMEEAVSAVSMEEAVSDVAPDLQAPSLAPDVSLPSSGHGTAAATGDGNGSEISMEKLRIGPSNTRKRDVPSTAWATSSSSLHKQRLDYSQDGEARSPPKTHTNPDTTPTADLEDTDQLQLMQQMQLSDRQASHAQAAHSQNGTLSQKRSNSFLNQSLYANGSRSQLPLGAGVRKKASSPDIPEPPHKKGSGQRKASEIPGACLKHALDLSNGDNSMTPKVPRSSTALKESNAISSVSVKESEESGSNRAVPVANGKVAVKDAPSCRTDAEAAQLKLAALLVSRDKATEALQIIEKLGTNADPDMLCLKGRCLSALDNRAGAFACFTAALMLDSAHMGSLLASGTLYKTCSLLSEAVDVFRRAHQAMPDSTDVQLTLAASLTDLGTKLKMSEKVDEGMKLYQEAIVVCPSYGPAYYNIGVVWSEARDYKKALEFYSKAIEMQPMHAEAHCNTGVIHKNQGRLEEAVAAYERALEVAPSFQIVQSNLAIALTEQATHAKNTGNMAEGIRLYKRALSFNPKYTEALYNLAVAYGESKRLQDAQFMYEVTLMVTPECAEAHNNLGVLHREQGNLEQALRCYLAALHIRPNFPQGLNNLAVVYTAQGKAQDAHQMLMAAITASPSYAEAYNNLGVLQRDVGAIQDALAAYDKCIELQPDSRNAGQNRLLALNYIHGGEQRFVCAAHEDWGREFQEQFTPLPLLPPVGVSDAASERPLVVGYVSPDFFTHSVSYFAEAPLTHHDPKRVRHIAYSCAVKNDSKTSRLRGAVEAAGGTWRDVSSLSEAELADIVREDKVDLLVDLTGHTANNRLGVFAMRPAPVQLTWIGYPNSTGLKGINYRLTDAVCDPLDTAQTFVEDLVRLPGCFLCYTPAHDAPPVSPLPAAELGFVTFGSFNALAKITPEVIKMWARLLLAVPGSRLLLKNKPSACASARAHFLQQMEVEGVAAQRVDLLPLTAGNAEHLATYAHMDISLDPWPYAGTTTTCESLYMGVPVLSLTGQCHAHNVGASLLTTLGLEKEWLACSLEQYLELAVKAASDLSSLAQLRASMRARMLASALCDGPAFVKQLEGVYRELWRRYVSAEGSAEEPADASR